MKPTEDHVMRKVRDIGRGDRVWIDDEWRTVEAGGSWPESPNTVELTTEPHSEGFTFNPSVSLPVVPDDNPAKAALRDHVSGAVERGEAEPIEAVENRLYVYTATVSVEATSEEEADRLAGEFCDTAGREGFGLSLEESSPEVQEID